MTTSGNFKLAWQIPVENEKKRTDLGVRRVLERRGFSLAFRAAAKLEGRGSVDMSGKK